MALDDIFPIAGKKDPLQLVPNSAPELDVNQTEVVGESPLAQIDAVPEELSIPEPSFANLIDKASSKRGLAPKDEPFGKSYVEQNKSPLADPISINKAALIQKGAAGEPIRFDMMAGNYFKQLPLITGRHSSTIPIAAMFAEELDKPGPAAKELAAFNKRIEKVDFFPSVSGLGEVIFKSDVTPIIDEAFATYGNRASLILNGGGLTKAERELGNRFNSTLSSVENLANLTNLTGKVVQKLQRDRSQNKWVDPETDKFTRDYLEGLEVMTGAPKEELFDYINKGTAKLKSLLAFGRGLDEEFTGNPTMSHLVEAQLGTAAEALKGTGATVFDTEQLIDVINAKNIPMDQVDSFVDTMWEKGYRFGGTEKEDRAKIRSKVMNYFIPSMRTTFLNSKYDKAVGTTKEYVATPVEDVYSVTKRNEDGKEEGKASFSSPAKWVFTEPLTENLSLGTYFNPSTNRYENASGDQKQTVSSVMVMPTHKAGPLKGQPISDILLPTLNKEDVVNRLVAVGTVRRIRKSKEKKLDEYGQPVVETGADEYVDEPAFWDYKKIEQSVKQRKITLRDINKEWGGSGKSVKDTGPKVQKAGTKTGQAAETIRAAATGKTSTHTPPGAGGRTPIKKPQPY